MNLNSSFIFNSQKMEKLKCLSVSKRINRCSQTADKRKIQLINPATWMNLINVTEWKESLSHRLYIHYVSGSSPFPLSLPSFLLDLLKTSHWWPGFMGGEGVTVKGIEGISWDDGIHESICV